MVKLIKMIETKVDKIAYSLEKKPKSIEALATELNISPAIIEDITYMLARSSEYSIFSVTYPPIGSPEIKLLKRLPISEEITPKNFDEEYFFEVFGVPVRIIIYKGVERRPFYHVITPSIGPYTVAFLEAIKPEIAQGIPFEAHYFVTPERMAEYLPKIRSKIKEKLSRYFSDEEGLEIITGSLFISMYGVGDLEIFLGDANLEEVAVNTATLPVGVYHRKYGWMKTNISIPDEDSIANISSQIARRVGESITIVNPILDAFLTTGDRAAATLFPISTRGNTITIRKFARDPWTITKFIENSTLSVEMAAILWQAVQYELNILVTGGTASGKTSLLNTLTHFIPNYQRVVTI